MHNPTKRPLMVDVNKHNQRSWDKKSAAGESPWVQPVTPGEIAAARSGDWQVILTPTKSVPRSWFGDLKNKTLLGLASGGGQQIPIFSAAGAVVTSFDQSSEQLNKDAQVAQREGLAIECIQGNMADLSVFDDASFDIIFHPVSNIFSADIRPVWQHCARILRPGGRLLSGFMNPDFYLFDHWAIEDGGPLEVRFKLPYADLTHVDPATLEARMAEGEALEFSHSLDEQIGGQLAAGLVVAGFYEDRWSEEATPLNSYMATSMATLAIKPAVGSELMPDV